jgi:hypothetical protein
MYSDRGDIFGGLRDEQSDGLRDTIEDKLHTLVAAAREVTADGKNSEKIGQPFKSGAGATEAGVKGLSCWVVDKVSPWVVVGREKVAKERKRPRFVGEDASFDGRVGFDHAKELEIVLGAESAGAIFVVVGLADKRVRS